MSSTRSPGRLRGFAWYSSQLRDPLRRRPTDVALLGGAAVGIALLAPAAPGPGAADEGLAAVLQSLPDWFSWVYAAAYAAGALWAALLLLVPLATPRRWRVTATCALAAALSFVLAAVVGAWEGTTWAQSWEALWSADGPPAYTAVRVAVIAGVVAAASPHLTHPVRVLGRVIVALTAVSAIALGLTFPIGALAGFLAGIAAAAIVHLVGGSPGGRPSPARVGSAMLDLGLEPASVTDAHVAPLGRSTFMADVPGLPPLLVTVLGRDERDARMLSSAWTAATVRGERLTWGRSRQARMEHAAMVGLLAERAGVSVPRVIGAGRSAEGDALLVTVAPAGRALGELRPDAVTDAILDATWSEVMRLHEAGIAHRRLSAATIVVGEAGQVTLIGLEDAEIGVERRDVMVDRARLLAATALLAGPERAVSSAQRVLAPEGLAEILPFLQPAVLDRQTRDRADVGELDLPALRDLAATAAGVEAPPLEQISRVSGGAIVRVLVIVLLTYGLITVFSGVDFAQVWESIQSADLALLVAALIVSLLAPVFFAFGTIGASTTELRYGPVLMLQYALQFIGTVLPSTAARIAMDVRFFQSFGVSPGASVSIGMIDSFSGFVVQAALLLVIGLSGLPGFTQSVSGSSSSSSDDGSSGPSLLALMVVIGVVSILVVLIVPRLRRQFWARASAARAAVLEQARNARGALSVVRHPKNVMQMIGGNLGGQVVQAIVLGMCLAAFGESASLSQLILINTAVSLFAGLMPVPGGVGVAEAGLTAGLVAIGVPSPIAISTAITFRLVTFYLPPLWGFWAVRWLRKRSYL